MNQQRINKYFDVRFGLRSYPIYSTPDDILFIRREEAVNNCNEKGLDENEIIEWYYKPKRK